MRTTKKREFSVNNNRGIAHLYYANNPAAEGRQRGKEKYVYTRKRKVKPERRKGDSCVCNDLPQKKGGNLDRERGRKIGVTM